MNRNEFLEAVAESLEVDLSLVEIHLSLGDLPEWDSLGHLTMLTFLDEKTQDKASEIRGIGSMESLNEIWEALVEAGLGHD
jgi:acyl carrier protein|tara:strand:- start:2719 stop:2961 length:243 start_codon:yes stop_codon:yes gene_type:complete